MHNKNPLVVACIWVALLMLAACGGGGSGGSGSSGSTTTTPPVSGYPRDSSLRLNQLQVLGTHNSYHSEPVQVGEPMATVLAGNVVYNYLWQNIFNYRHGTLTQQLNDGVRQLELDVWADPAGGAYATASLLGGASFGIPALANPGLKVLHVAQLDPHSSCYTLVACLTEIKTWSDAHPQHAPLMVMIEIKDEDAFATAPGLTQWVTADYDALDAEIRSVFPADKLITPDDVQGFAATLKDAILTSGWPTLAQTRGKVMFTDCACISSTPGRQATDYLRTDGSLTGRVMFPNMANGVTDASTLPNAAGFFVFDDPVTNQALISALVTNGFLVRTQADSNGVEARSNSVTRRDTAFAAGAQFVSTDYEHPDAVIGTSYVVSVPGGTPARCNPVSAQTPVLCQSSDIETP